MRLEDAAQLTDLGERGHEPGPQVVAAPGQDAAANDAQDQGPTLPHPRQRAGALYGIEIRLSPVSAPRNAAVRRPVYVADAAKARRIAELPCSPRIVSTSMVRRLGSEVGRPSR